MEKGERPATLQGILLKRSDHLGHWRERQAAVCPAPHSAGAGTLRWHGGAQPGSILLDEICQLRVIGDHLVVRRHSEELHFRALSGGHSITDWRRACEAASTAVPPPATASAGAASSVVRGLLHSPIDLAFDIGHHFWLGGAQSQKPAAAAAALYCDADDRSGLADAVSLPAAGLPPLQAGRVRVVCVSDTHERHDSVQLPAGDVLVHCGDAMAISRHFSRLHSIA